MTAKSRILYILFVVNLIRFSESYNILVIFGHPGKSHYDVFKPLFQELGERGHNITILTHVKSEGDIKNGKDVLLSETHTLTSDFLDFSGFSGDRVQKYIQVHILANFADMTCQPSLESKEMQEFLKEDHRFDIILVELFNTNCFYGLINKFQAPFIGLSSCQMMPWHAEWFGASTNPSYIPSVYLAHPPPMNFLHRVENTLVHLGHKLWYKFFMEQPGTKLSKKYTGYEPADPYNASLIFINVHHSLHGVRPLTPAIVEVGGIHVANKKAKKLPQDIEKWTNESHHGLIYFSLGSLIKGYTFPEDKLQAFLNVFSKLPQRILWKWENDSMRGQPDNLMLTKWAPQFDILCHPNTKLFISHGGVLGTTEAVHCGVPILVMPQFADQTLNANALERNGAGVILQLKEATEKSINEALKKALSVETRKKAKELSQRFRDRLASPLDTAVYWVEHVARYKGGRHMRSDAIDIPLYQYLLLDVVGFLGLVVFLIIFVIYSVLRLLCHTSSHKVKTS